MPSYILRRLLAIVPTLAIIITLTFLLMRLTPGGPFDLERPLPDDVRVNLERYYHLDQPLWVQFGHYVKGLVRGDFGPSFRYKDQTVTELIRAGLPVSLRLGVTAMALALLIGIPAGVLAALRYRRPTDYAVMGLAMTGVAVPNFVVAPLLVLVFALSLGWLPVGGWGGGAFRNMVLPVTALALPYIAFIARIARAGMLDVLSAPFILTARAKGLPRRTVVARHALKPAMLPVVSFLGPALAGIITGSLVVEQIFGLPGLGRYFVQGALNRDYTLVMGVVIFYATTILLLNLLVDVVYAVLDPRVKHR